MLVIMTACTSWQPYTLNRGSDLPELLRLRLTSGEQVELREPSIEGDSALVGLLSRTGPDARVLLRDVQTVDRGSFSPGKTLLAVVGTGAIALVALVAVVWSDWD